MSNTALAIQTVALPAHVQARMGQPSALATSLAGGLGGGTSYPRISIKGSRFRIVEGDEETVLDKVTLDVVMVGANPRLSKQYYAKAWDPNDAGGAPDCFSLGGVSPDTQSTQPQNDLCSTCPHNAWGSKIGPQGQKLKSCSDTKRLAVLAAEDVGGPTYLLAVTPAALKDLHVYQKGLQERGIAPEIVITRIGFDTNASFPKLTFSLGGFVSEEDFKIVEDVLAGGLPKTITGEDDPNTIQATVVEQPKPAAKAPVVKAAAPAPAPTPAPTPAPAPAAAPAAPKRGFGGGTKTAAAAPAAAAPAPAAPKAKTKTPVAAPAATTGTGNLAEDIMNLMNAEQSDDASAE